MKHYQKTKADVTHRLRQLLLSGRKGMREITLEAKQTGDTSCLDASGAIRLTIQDILPTIDNSLGMPPGLEIELGVTGQEVWPYSIDDVEVEEEGEIDTLTDQTPDFANLQCETPVRTAMTVIVSNRAIDAAGFDLLAFVRSKFAIAQRRYIAQRLYSTAQFSGGNYGPFAENHSGQYTLLEGDIYDAIMNQMTVFEQAGFDTSKACIVVDSGMETLLKCTPIRSGEGRMIIQNGRCAGYPYVVNNYFNTELDANGKLVKRKMSDAIGIGLFEWFKIAQHGTARLTIDGKSKEMASRNVTAITLNTSWSFTDLSAKINGGSDMQAFHTLMMERMYLADVNDLIFESSDNLLLTVQQYT